MEEVIRPLDFDQSKVNFLFKNLIRNFRENILTILDKRGIALSIQGRFGLKKLTLFFLNFFA